MVKRPLALLRVQLPAWWAATLLLLPMPGLAQRLGDEVILSRLGDPVEVEIAVEAWQGFDISQLQAGNGDAGQYQLFGLEYQPILDNLSYALIGPNLAGEVKVLVSSRDPVSEPFLELLLVLRWPSGSTLRDYTLLFDPPLVAPAVSADVPQPVQPTMTVTPPASAVPAEPALPQIADSGQPDVRTQAAIVVDAVADDPAAATMPSTDALNVARRQYQVRDGDTLWVIARQFQPAGATENLYQFLVSLHDLNRDAFINGNISLLQAGAMLRVPTAGDVGSINPATAQALFEDRWTEGTRIATGTASAPPVEFTALNEPATAEVPAPVAEAPQRPAGTELATANAQENTGLLTPANTAVIAVATAAAQPPVSALADAEAALAADTVAVPQSLLAASDNPYLQRVTDSALAIQQLLESRERRVAQVEEQLLAMRIQMQEAQIATLQLNAKLQQAAATRTAQREKNLRNTAFLATLVAGLLLALMLTLRKLLALQGQLRMVRVRPVITLAHSPGQQIKVAPTSGFPAQGRAEVAENEEITLEELTPTDGVDKADEPARNDDKVPDIEVSVPQGGDFAAAGTSANIEERGHAPKSVV